MAPRLLLDPSTILESPRKRARRDSAAAGHGSHPRSGRIIASSTTVSTANDAGAGKGDGQPAEAAPAMDEAALDKVKQQGLEVLKQVKDARDKGGRPLAPVFVRRPNPRTYPDYYQVIKRPIALDDIRSNLDERHYRSLDAVKADFDLCFNNAKRYNMRESEIWEDARTLQRLVKNVVSSFQPAPESPPPQNSPSASQGPSSLRPSPAIPPSVHGTATANGHAPQQQQHQYHPHTVTLRKKPTATDSPLASAGDQKAKAKAFELWPSVVEPSPAISRPVSTDGVDETGEEDGADFSPGARSLKSTGRKRGKYLRSALKRAVDAVIRLTDPNGRTRSDMFMELPSRADYPEYYKVIERPISFDTIQDKMKKKNYMAADDLVEDMRLMFENAMFFNEPGSEVWEDAKAMLDYFLHVIVPTLPQPGETTADFAGESGTPSAAPSGTIKVRLGLPASPSPPAASLPMPSPSVTATPGAPALDSPSSLSSGKRQKPLQDASKRSQKTVGRVPAPSGYLQPLPPASAPIPGVATRGQHMSPPAQPFAVQHGANASPPYPHHYQTPPINWSQPASAPGQMAHSYAQQGFSQPMHAPSQSSFYPGYPPPFHHHQQQPQLASFYAPGMPIPSAVFASPGTAHPGFVPSASPTPAYIDYAAHSPALAGSPHADQYAPFDPRSPVSMPVPAARHAGPSASPSLPAARSPLSGSAMMSPGGHHPSISPGSGAILESPPRAPTKPRLPPNPYVVKGEPSVKTMIIETVPKTGARVALSNAKVRQHVVRVGKETARVVLRLVLAEGGGGGKGKEHGLHPPNGAGERTQAAAAEVEGEDRPSKRTRRSRSVAASSASANGVARSAPDSVAEPASDRDGDGGGEDRAAANPTPVITVRHNGLLLDPVRPDAAAVAANSLLKSRSLSFSAGLEKDSPGNKTDSPRDPRDGVDDGGEAAPGSEAKGKGRVIGGSSILSAWAASGKDGRRKGVENGRGLGHRDGTGNDTDNGNGNEATISSSPFSSSSASSASAGPSIPPGTIVPAAAAISSNALTAWTITPRDGTNVVEIVVSYSPGAAAAAEGKVVDAGDSEGVGEEEQAGVAAGRKLRKRKVEDERVEGKGDGAREGEWERESPVKAVEERYRIFISR